MIHTFFDGIAIAPGFLGIEQPEMDYFSLRFFLHKIPEGFTVASVDAGERSSPAHRVGASALLAATFPPGVLTMAVLHREVSFGRCRFRRE